MPKPIRGRPRSPTLDDRILAAAIRLLGSHGYDGLTMDKVAKSARTTKTTVYKRFGNKTHLIEAAISHLGEQVARYMQPRAKNAERAVTNFRHRALELGMVETLAAVILVRRLHPQLAAAFGKWVLDPHLANLRIELRGLGLRGNIESVTMQAMGYAVVEAIHGQPDASQTASRA